jgi:flavorubredoxin
LNPFKTNIPVLRISSILGTNSYYIAAEHPTLIDTGHPASTYLLQTLSSNNIDLNEIK